MRFEPHYERNNFERAFTAIDTHTSGEFTRIIIDGFPELKGNTMIERMHYAEENYSHYRKALMLEPRGHNDMFGALLTEPIHQDAQIGVIFFDTLEWITMCGHGTIGCATAAVEMGLIPVTEPYTEVVLEAPAGLIRTKVKVENGRAVNVTLTNVPSFLYKDNLNVEVDGQQIKYDLAFGGNFFPLIDAGQFDMDINEKTAPFFIEKGIRILRKINEKGGFKHPELDIDFCAGCEFYGAADTPDATMKNIVVFGRHQADRSPCGTGTSAKLSALYEQGKIKIGDPFVYESFIGTKFTGVIKGTTKLGDFTAIIPEITGSAFVTGLATYLVDERDPLKYGFLIGE